MSPAEVVEAPAEGAESPGLPAPGGLTGEEDGGDAGRPMIQGWISADLVAYTRKVWERFLGRAVADEEAIEMLVNVKRLAGTLLKAATGPGRAVP